MVLVLSSTLLVTTPSANHCFTILLHKFSLNSVISCCLLVLQLPYCSPNFLSSGVFSLFIVLLTLLHNTTYSLRFYSSEQCSCHLANALFFTFTSSIVSLVIQTFCVFLLLCRCCSAEPTMASFSSFLLFLWLKLHTWTPCTLPSCPLIGGVLHQNLFLDVASPILSDSTVVLSM